MADKTFVEFMGEDLPVEGNPIPKTEAEKRFFCRKGGWKKVREPGLDCQIPSDIREEILREVPPRSIMTEEERAAALEKLEMDLFGHILTPEEREEEFRKYLSQRTQRYPWQDVTWEGTEGEIPLRDREKMKEMDKVCRDLVLDNDIEDLLDD